jgi:hypothetical protein
MNQFASTLRRLAAATCFATALLLTGVAHGQGTPGSGGPVPGTPDPTPVPLDGGASLLLAGGAAYALSLLRQRRRKAA